MSAKIDNAAVQDGYTLYHHVILFDGEGNWTVVQQGLNPNDRMARRYHWISDNLKSFVYEPHTGIISKCKVANTLNMISIDSEENQKICVDLATGNIDNLKSSIYKIATINKRREEKTLDDWIWTCNLDSKHTVNNNNNNDGLTERYEMPRRLDWNVFRRIYDIQPQNYEQLISISGIGPAAIRALSLIGEIIFGTKASWQDPVKYNFAHGGKDGVPYPIARKTYDKSISYLSSAIEGAEIEREQRIGALRRLAEYSARMF
jgi:hypothetical protein